MLPTAIERRTRCSSARPGLGRAILYAIIEACRSRGIDPQSYMRVVLTRLQTLTNLQIKDVTPEPREKKPGLLALAH